MERRVFSPETLSKLKVLLDLVYVLEFRSSRTLCNINIMPCASRSSVPSQRNATRSSSSITLLVRPCFPLQSWPLTPTATVDKWAINILAAVAAAAAAASAAAAAAAAVCVGRQYVAGVHTIGRSIYVRNDCRWACL